MEHAGEFASEGATVVQKLRQMDLDRRLGEVSRQSAETQQLMDRQLDRLNQAMDDVKERNNDIVKASGSLREKDDSMQEETTKHTDEIVDRAVQEVHERLDSLSGHVCKLEEMQKESRCQLAADRKTQQFALGAMWLLLLIVVLQCAGII